MTDAQLATTVRKEPHLLRPVSQALTMPAKVSTARTRVAAMIAQRSITASTTEQRRLSFARMAGTVQPRASPADLLVRIVQKVICAQEVAR